MIGLYVDWYFYGYSCAGYTSLWFKSGPSIFAGICIKEVNFLVIFWTFIGIYMGATLAMLYRLLLG